VYRSAFREESNRIFLKKRLIRTNDSRVSGDRSGRVIAGGLNSELAALVESTDETGLECPGSSGHLQFPASSFSGRAGNIRLKSSEEKGNLMSTSSGDTAAAPGEKPVESKRILAGVLAILLGTLGVHKFVLGMTTPGIIMLAVSLVSCGFAAPIISLIGLIEGIIYLTKTDEEFHRVYEVEKKQWF
jgi:TM2 domain-containing membrane protein YozV